LASPFHVRLADHGCEGALAEEGKGAGTVAPHLGFEVGPGLPEFLRRDVARLLRRPTDHGGDPASIVEKLALLLRRKANIGEAGEVQDEPEAIAAAREIVALESGSRRRIDAAEDDV
jgi:hypothetical protein